MSQFMVIATLKLNDESLLSAWKELSRKISSDLEGQDGFISRDVVRADDGVISCILKWESKAQQEKFMEVLTARTDLASETMMTEFARVADVANIKQEFLEVL